MKNLAGLLLLIALILLPSLIWFTVSITPKATGVAYQTFIIEEGQSLTEISKRLERDNLIKNSLAFQILATLKGRAQKVQAGSFQISPTQSASEILNQLTTGTFDVWVTIPEGWRVEEISQHLNQKLGIDEGEFVKVAKEGYMFPDTYLIPQKATSQEVAKIMLDNFNNRLGDNLKKQIQNSNLNLEQIVILASIVEREAKFDKDRPTVAGILVKRLQEDLPLEADATVQYAVGYQPQEKSWWKAQLSTADLNIDSAYNTRKFKGLPPTPICNPGLSSIEAVVNPTKSDFYYYLSDESGNMHYARTLEEHIENIGKYL